MRKKLFIIILFVVFSISACTKTTVPNENPIQNTNQQTVIEDKEQKEVTLYFADSQAMFVIGEKRVITYPKNASKEEIYKEVLNELIAGPKKEGLYKTIPDEAKVLDISISGDLIKVNFNEEMKTKHWGGAAGESMTIASIVNSLTEFDEIKRVLLNVAGEPMNIEHMIIEEPLERMEDMIYKQ